MFKYRKLWCALAGAGLLALTVSWAAAQQGVSRGPGGPPPPPGEQPPPPPTDDQRPPLPEIPADATPEEIVEFCITHATMMADRCVERNTTNAGLCVEIIEGFLAEGEVAKARHVGRWCIAAINGGTDRCIREVHRLCRRCTRGVLEAGGGRELIEQMRQGCGDQLRRAAESRREAIAAIKQALGLDEEEGIESVSAH